MQIAALLGVVMLAISFVLGEWALADKISGRSLEGITTGILTSEAS